MLLLLLSSFQLFFLFVLGQYVARTYDEARSRPLYVVASKSGFDEVPRALSAPAPDPLNEPAPVPVGERVDNGR